MSPTKPKKGKPLAQSRVQAARSGPRVPVFAVVVGVLVAVVLITVVVIRVAGDDGDDGGSGGGTLAAGDQAFGPVEVEGEHLPRLPDGGDDPAVGLPAPALEAETPSGEAISIRPGDDGPMVLVFLAHWCPHCQAEVPRIVDLADDDGRVDGVPAVAVLTSSTPDRENFPPGEWLAEEGWSGDAMVDSDPGDPEGTSLPDAFSAYGVTGFPFLVAIDGDGNVAARTSGELGTDGLREVFGLVAD